MARRRFLNSFLGTSLGTLGAAVAYPILRFLQPPRVPETPTSAVDAGRVDDPEFLGRGFKIVPFGQEPVIVVRLSPTDFRALSATCTHLDCIVEYRREQQVIWCNCHNGRFALDGRVIGGPPPRPLRRLAAHLAEGLDGQPGRVVVTRS